MRMNRYESSIKNNETVNNIKGKANYVLDELDDMADMIVELVENVINSIMDLFAKPLFIFDEYIDSKEGLRQNE